MVEQLEYKFGFEKLEVWQSAMDLSKFVYSITEKFPQSELYNLTSQMRRAAISIPSNIAEGSCKSSLKEQAKFSEIAFGSLMELLCQLILSNEQNYLHANNYSLCREKVEQLSRQLNAYKNSQIRRMDNV